MVGTDLEGDSLINTTLHISFYSNTVLNMVQIWFKHIFFYKHEKGVGRTIELIKCYLHVQTKQEFNLTYRLWQEVH